MLREMTIGQYYPSNSILHKLDPRTKIIGTLVYMLSLFIFGGWITYILATLFLAMAIVLSKVPVRYIFRGIKPLLILLIITIICNMLIVPGEYIFQWWIIKVSKEGVINAAVMALRLIYLIFGSSLLTFTTTPNHLTDALESLFKPLRVLKVPVHEMAMMMSIALRFIPILLEETDKIMKAQLARGADFDSGNFLQKAKSLIPVLVPLFVSAFRRANDLAMAMEARCYMGGDGRTKMKPLCFTKKDAMAFIVIGLYLILLIVLRIIT